MTKKTETKSIVNQDIIDFRHLLIEKMNGSGPYNAKIIEDVLSIYNNHFGSRGYGLG